MTVQLRALEEELGRPLFVRRSRGVTPTTAADELAGRLGPHLDALEAIVEDRLPAADPRDRTLHLGGPADLTTAKIIPALASLIGDGLRVRITFGLPDQLIDGLVAGLHDLVISTVRPRQPSITAKPLVTEEFVLVAGADWAARLPVAVAADGGETLAQIPLVAYGEKLPMVRRYWLAVFGRRPPMHAAVVVPDLRAVLAAVVAGVGMSVLPTYLVAKMIESGELVCLHEPKMRPRNMLYLVTRAGPSQPQVKLARQHLLTQAKHW